MDSKPPVTTSMAPSVDMEGESTPAQQTNTAKELVENSPKEQSTGSSVGEKSQANKSSKAINGSQRVGKPVEGSKEEKLSGKELKEKAKAEKAARRAKEKQEQQGQPVVSLGTNKQPEPKVQKTPKTAAAASSSAPKVQHKRTGSVGGNTQKLPIRPSQGQAPPTVQEPEKENKNVALFDHLYGPPRRTTIAGAGKDVHPAVLALGLQMRNYTICGSSARCVATLLAFKRVCGPYKIEWLY